MWCIPPAQDAAFVAAMEQVLTVYHRPYDPLFPVVNMDEQPIQLISHSRDPLPMRPGDTAKVDYEYIREGMCNAFMFDSSHLVVGAKFTSARPRRQSIGQAM